jgi:hypothetical protein
MFYHHRDLRYVKYGTVYPTPAKSVSDFLGLAYEWLGQFCGFAPQVWLARNCIEITGAGMRQFPGQTEKDYQGILFGFDHTSGFPVHYEFWCFLLNTLINARDVADANAQIPKLLDWLVSDRTLPDTAESRWWRKTRDVSEVLRHCLFIERDQIVVSQLNLQAATLIVCTTEQQKRILRRRGFMETRIVVQDIKLQD